MCVVQSVKIGLHTRWNLRNEIPPTNLKIYIVMIKIRIGKDIRFELMSYLYHLDWLMNDYTFTLITPSKKEIELPFVIVENKLVACYLGIEQKELGNYTITIWINRNKKGQTVKDFSNSFKLCPNTEDDDVLEITPVVIKLEY